MAISISSLVPELQPYCRELLRIAGENRLEPRLTSARRSLQEQRELYNRFLRGANPFPVAPPGTSAHETGEAFDLLVTPVDYLPALGDLWISWGGQWGGNRDPVHFQLPGAPSPELLAQTQGAASEQSTGNSLGDWILQRYGEIPWWISYFLPVGTTVESAKTPATQRVMEKILRDAGLW